MEKEGTDKEIETKSPQSGKKYVTTWRNKWLTSKAGSIDDFIKIYEETAELMRRWKSEGIIIDPDIIGNFGDDYAQFCTYDERVAIKEGFEEEIIEEEYEEEFSDNSYLEFQINEYLTLKLVDKFIKIYINGEVFNQCRYLLIIDPQDREDQDEIDSIDEAESLYSKNLERSVTPAEVGITKEQEFWAHCSV